MKTTKKERSQETERLSLSNMMDTDNSNFSEMEGKIYERDEEDKPIFVKETPFVIVKIEDYYKIVIGDNICSEKNFNTPKEALEYIEKKPWTLIQIIAYMIANNMDKLK